MPHRLSHKQEMVGEKLCHGFMACHGEISPVSLHEPPRPEVEFCAKKENRKAKTKVMWIILGYLIRMNLLSPLSKNLRNY